MSASPVSPPGCRTIVFLYMLHTGTLAYEMGLKGSSLGPIAKFGYTLALQERLRRRRRAFASRDVGNDEPKESVVQYDNEAFTDDEKSEDLPAASPSVSPSSARPSPRILPPLRERVAETSDGDLSSGSQTPSSVASSRVSAADRDRRRRRPSEVQIRRPWERSRATPSKLVAPTPLPRKGRIQQPEVEEEVIEKALKKRREALARWKSSASSALRQSAELAEKTLVEEATEFFTRKWTKEVPPGSAEQKTKEVKEARRSSAVDGGDNAPEGATPDVNESLHEAEEDEEHLLTSDDYVPDEQLACKIAKAEYNPSVDTNLHFPSSTKVPFSAKSRSADGNEDDSNDRSRPGSPIRNNLSRFAINQMEHRLINQGELQWFNSEGAVDTSPITISDKPFRLRSYEDETRAFKPKYTKLNNQPRPFAL
ncbi:uncharacterized protein LOC142558551 [Dermacentor variabilis]|uniref:uncharacterized protein LOC142558551 n=1 Tax=Dermacentor variabilis TaxID=34621 RepID=UPI003F5BEDD3